MVISLAVPKDHGCRLTLAPALDFRPTQRVTDLCGRAGDCYREDCPFQSGTQLAPGTGIGCCCSHPAPVAGFVVPIWTVNIEACRRCFPRLHEAPCSA